MIKKFHAGTTREALRLVRDALGANAIILSNRPVDGGVEIIAVADLDMAALTDQAEPVVARMAGRRPAPRSTAMDAGRPELTSFSDYLAQRQPPPREASVIRPTPARQQATPPRPPSPAQSAPRPAAAEAKASAVPLPAVIPTAAPAAELPPAMQELAREMRLLRALVEGQLAGLAWGDAYRREPHRAEAMKRLLAAGFSPALTKQLLERLPPEPDIERAIKWVRAAIAHNLKVADPGQDLVDAGGIYALVGPTGVGKTTTVAKLAARAVLKFGATRVAMVTADSYRIGAQDQLRIYGRILGTPVYSIRDENDLELTLLDLQDKHAVFIDTIGMSQRDQRVAEQIAMFSGDSLAVKRLLLLGAPSQGITLEEVVRAYSGPGLVGCILTKIDEALSFGPALDVSIRHQLKVFYVTNGQRVPEDLHLANARYLVDRAFRLAAPEAAFITEDADYPVLMAAAQACAAVPDEYLAARGAYGANA